MCSLGDAVQGVCQNKRPPRLGLGPNAGGKAGWCLATYVVQVAPCHPLAHRPDKTHCMAPAMRPASYFSGTQPTYTQRVINSNLRQSAQITMRKLLIYNEFCATRRRKQFGGDLSAREGLEEAGMIGRGQAERMARMASWRSLGRSRVKERTELAGRSFRRRRMSPSRQ